MHSILESTDLEMPFSSLFLSLSICGVAAVRLDIPIHVFGPETHMTAIVGMALGQRPIPKSWTEPPSVSLLQGSKSVSL